MKIVNIFIIVLISILIFSGCSMKNNKKEIDEATQQKNITKVQNDINEIMGKSYDYIIENMGKPYLTTCYINTEDYKNYKELDLNEIIKKLDIEMVYPKQGYESSALYIKIKDNKVADVLSNEFVGTSRGFENLSKDSKSIDFIIDVYNNQKCISEKKLKGIAIESYKDKNINKLMKDIQLDMPNAVAYSNTNDKTINYFIIGENKENLKYIIAVTEEKGKIINISKLSNVSLINTLVDISS